MNYKDSKRIRFYYNHGAFFADHPIINMLYAKWVVGSCHHLCLFCEWKNDCWGSRLV